MIPCAADPFRINLVHPVIALTETVIGVATARPMTERHRCRHTGLAGVNLAAVFRCQQAEIEQFVGNRCLLQNRNSLRRKAIGFRHLSGTGPVIPRRGADDQDLGRARGIFLLRFGRRNGVARLDPFNRKIVIGIGKAGAGFACQGRFTALLVIRPGDRFEATDRILFSREIGIVKRSKEMSAKGVPGQFAFILSLADVGHGSGPGEGASHEEPALPPFSSGNSSARQIVEQR